MCIQRTLAALERYLAVMADDDVMMIEHVSGKRYGEVLLVRPATPDPQATVYNSFPLNDCPAELWSKLDPQAIAAENGAAAALLNGPRYWLMSSIEKGQGPRSTRASAASR